MTIAVPNNSIAEINIIVPVSKLEKNSVALLKPDGSELDAEKDGSLISTGKYFSCYKIVNPTAGDWKLTYRSDNSSSISVQYIFSYGVQAYVQSDAAVYSKHQPVTVTAYYSADGLPTKDHLLYNVPATIRLWKNGVLLSEDTMAVNGTGDGYTFTYEGLDAYGAGAYEYTVTFEGDGLMRTSDTLTFELVNDAPVLTDGTVSGGSFETTINIPSQPETYEIASREWDLSSMVKDVNGDSISFSVKSVDADVDASIDGSRLVIRTRKNTGTEGQVIVACQDAGGAAGPELTFRVAVTDYESRYDAYTAALDQVNGALKNADYPLVLTIKNGDGQNAANDVNLPSAVEINVADSQGNKSTLTLTADNTGRWNGSIHTADVETTYTLNAVITVGQKKITMEPLTIVVGNSAPIIAAGKKDNDTWSVNINDPQDDASFQAQSRTWDLNTLVQDPNGDRLTFIVAGNGADVNASIDPNGVLTISTRLNTATEGDVVVTCQDNDGLAGPTLTFHVAVKNVGDMYSEYTAKLAVDKTNKSSLVTLTLTVYREGGIIDTGDVNMPSALEATVRQGENEETVTMTRGADGLWTGSFNTVDHIAGYTVDAAVRISSEVIVTAPTLSFETVNAGPVIQKQPATAIPGTFYIEPFLLWSKETKPVVLDLNEYFTDADSDALTYQAEGDTAAVTISGSTLTVDASKAAGKSVSFTVTAKDNDGAAVTSASVTFAISSQKQTGIITIAIVAAAIILLLIIIQAAKPKYPNARFFVSVDEVPYGEGQQLPRGSMAKKEVKLQPYAPTMAQGEYGPAIHAVLGSITLKPAGKMSVKVDATKAGGVDVAVNGKAARKGTLANGGKLQIRKDGKVVTFKLEVVTNAARPAAGSGTSAQTKATVTRSTSGSRT